MRDEATIRAYRDVLAKSLAEPCGCKGTRHEQKCNAGRMLMEDAVNTLDWALGSDKISDRVAAFMSQFGGAKPFACSKCGGLFSRDVAEQGEQKRRELIVSGCNLSRLLHTCMGCGTHHWYDDGELNPLSPAESLKVEMEYSDLLAKRSSGTPGSSQILIGKAGSDQVYAVELADAESICRSRFETVTKLLAQRQCVPAVVVSVKAAEDRSGVLTGAGLIATNGMEKSEMIQFLKDVVEYLEGR